MGSAYADTKKNLSHPIYATYYEDLISNSSWIVGQIYWQHTIHFFLLQTFSDNQTYICTLLFALKNKDMFLIAGNIFIFFFLVITMHTTLLWCTREPLELSSLVMEQMYTDVLDIPQCKVKICVTWDVFNHFVIMWQWSNLLIAVFG